MRSDYEQLATMIRIASVAHEGQFDKGGKPYILHAISVMHMVKSTNPLVQAAAVGHDLFEDTKVVRKDLKDAGICDFVIDIIMRLTKMPGQSHDEYKEVVFFCKNTMLVKEADLRHNSDIRRLKGISASDIARMERYAKFYSQIRERLAKEHDIYV